MIDAGDRRGLEQKQSSTMQSTDTCPEFLKLIQPLRDLVRIAAQTRRDEASAMADNQKRGPIMTEAPTWTQSQCQEWCPPHARILLDKYNGRFRITYGRRSRESLSRSWAMWGYSESLLIVLRAAWTWYSFSCGVRCWIPGIMGASATSPPAEAPPPAAGAAVPPARGRGRGRGRGKGKAKACAKAAASGPADELAAPPPAAPAAAPEVAAVVSHETSDSSSTSSSSSDADHSSSESS